MCPSTQFGTHSSFGPIEPSKPLNHVPPLPGITMFVLSAVKPRETTSFASAVTSLQLSIGGLPTSSWWRTRVVPQCDQ
jgi:hypothetical protein